MRTKYFSKIRCACGRRTCEQFVSLNGVARGKKYARGHSPEIAISLKKNKAFMKYLIARNKRLGPKSGATLKRRMLEDKVFAENVRTRLTARNKSADMRQRVSEALREYHANHPDEARRRASMCAKERGEKLSIKYATDRIFQARKRVEGIKKSIMYRKAFALGLMEISPSSVEKVSTRKGGLVTCRSGWEKIFVRALELSLKVKTFLYEPFRLRYTYEGRLHTVVPDFFVRFVDGSEMVVDVTGWEKHIAPVKVERKHSATRAYCKKNGYGYSVLGSIKEIRDFALRTLVVWREELEEVCAC